MCRVPPVIAPGAPHPWDAHTSGPGSGPPQECSMSPLGKHVAQHARPASAHPPTPGSPPGPEPSGHVHPARLEPLPRGSQVPASCCRELPGSLRFCPCKQTLGDSSRPASRTAPSRSEVALRVTRRLGPPAAPPVRPPALPGTPGAIGLLGGEESPGGAGPTLGTKAKATARALEWPVWPLSVPLLGASRGAGGLVVPWPWGPGTTGQQPLEKPELVEARTRHSGRGHLD